MVPNIRSVRSVNVAESGLFKGTTRGMRMAFAGFFVAALGALPALAWSMATNAPAPRLLIGVSFFLTCLGILTGAAGMLRMAFVELPASSSKKR
jgi:hypothetical protein